MIINYSEDASLNIILFLAKKNKINFFVEDCNKEYEYERIFCRLLNIKVNNNFFGIFPMNGKMGVKQAYNIYGTCYESRPLVYIADGDFDLILGKEMICDTNFIYLDRYNIESYYVDKEAVVKFMMGKLKCMRESVLEKIDFEEWERDTYSKLKKLFLLFVIGQMAIPQRENVGGKLRQYINKSGMVDAVKIDCYQRELTNLIGIDKINKYIVDVEKEFEDKLQGDIKRLLCGKYLLASLSQYLRVKTNIGFRGDDLRYYLIGEFDINSLCFVRERIEKIVYIEI